MAMGSRKRKRQTALWIATGSLPKSQAHPFYKRLNALLAKHGFDAFVEGLCAPFYAGTMGRPGIAPGVYFRMLMLGFFEGIDSERGIAWRCSDSLSLRTFLDVELGERTRRITRRCRAHVGASTSKRTRPSSTTC